MGQAFLLKNKSSGINTSDATITAKDISYGKMAYGSDGQIIGNSAFEYIGENNYKFSQTSNPVFISSSGIGKTLVVETTESEWNSVTLPTSSDWESIAYGKGRFVAISRSGIAIYSDNGINWTQITMPSIQGWWWAITYGNDRFVAIGEKITAYSTDGINWVETTNSQLKSYSSISYGNNKFVSVQNNGKRAIYSSDGVTWVETTLPQGGYWYSIAYGNNRFVAIATNSDIIAYSDDGITWNSAPIPMNSWLSVAYGNGKFVAVGYDISAYSTDGISWTQSTLPGEFHSVAYGNDKFVAMSESSEMVAYSNDGINWTQSTFSSPGFSAGGEPSIAYGNNRFVAVSYNSNIAVYQDYYKELLFLEDKLVVSSVLNDNSWNTISKVAAKGEAANYWSVGDCKAVDIKGTVGTLSINGTYYVYILGFDHNGATNTIDFGTFKTAASGGKDIALVNSYGSTNTSGTKYFNMSHRGNYSYGGWKGSDMRYDILGSTDKAPSGYNATITSSRVGYDATPAALTSPVADTLLAALPSELRVVMKPMTVYTANTTGSDTASYVTASIDYLPLLSEFEIFGARTNANSAEKNYQKQYDYYKNGNSKVKYRHNANTSTANWLTRSPRYTGSTAFCVASTGGAASTGYPYTSYGIAPIFRV